MLSSATNRKFADIKTKSKLTKHYSRMAVEVDGILDKCIYTVDIKSVLTLNVIVNLLSMDV